MKKYQYIARINIIKKTKEMEKLQMQANINKTRKPGEVK